MTTSPRTYFSVTSSPIGRLLFVARGDALAGLYMEKHSGAPLDDAAWIQDESRFTAARTQLAEYFAGTRTSFDLPLALVGTPFQRRVWNALLAIPFGETISYGELARRVGSPKAARAVGHSNARNPVSIVVPCHRVIGANGALTGYGGGEERKRWLLDWERGRAVAPHPAARSSTLTNHAATGTKHARSAAVPR
jgi:methylated-DNA-[protein]-cysteine S-methyltransferase